MASERDIYNALVKNGFSMTQAAGIMGNMQNESSFNVESNAIDSNGFPAVGLISWNEASYPNAGTLVTGNQKRDLAAQMKYLKTQTHGFSQGVKGATAEDVAGNWAEFVEVCQGCAPGGAQWSQRRANAHQIFSDAKAGKWPTGPGVQSGSGGGGGGGKIVTTSIFDSLNNINSFFADLLSADFWERAGLVLFGAILVIVGIIILAGPTARGAAETGASLTRTGRTLGLAGGGDSGPSPEQIANRQARLQVARRNTALGERHMALREKAEVRKETHSRETRELAQKREVRTAEHKDREISVKERKEARIASTQKHSGRREPNPAPRHS